MKIIFQWLSFKNHERVENKPSLFSNYKQVRDNVLSLTLICFHILTQQYVTIQVNHH